MKIWANKTPIYLLAKLLKKQETDDIVKKRKECVKRLLSAKESVVKEEPGLDGESIGGCK